MGAVPLMVMKAGTIVLNRIQAAKGSQWRSRMGGGSHGRIWVDRKWSMLQRFSCRSSESSQDWFAVVQVGDDQRSDQELRCVLCEEKLDPVDAVLLKRSRHSLMFEKLPKSSHVFWKIHHLSSVLSKCTFITLCNMFLKQNDKIMACIDRYSWTPSLY